MSVSFFICCLIPFSVRARNLLNLKTYLFLQWIIPFWKTYVSTFCHNMFRYLLWHCFLMCFGIDFGFLFGTLSLSMFVFWGARFVDCICHVLFAILRPKTSGRGFRGMRPSRQNRVSAPPSFQGSSAWPKSRFGAAIVPRKFFHRFGTVLGSIWRWFRRLFRRCSVVFCNTNDKCLYTCAVAEPRLAALKINK